MAQPPTLATERLTLRAFEPGDIDDLAPLFADAGAMWDVLSIPGMPRDPREAAAQRIGDAISGWETYDAGFWAVVSRTSELASPGRLLGYCGFVNPAKGEIGAGAEETFEVGWAIFPAFRRRGLAAEAMTAVLDHAFRRMGCTRLIGITDPANRASRALMERLGFVFEADVHAYGVPQVRYELTRAAHLAHKTRRSGCR
ncbi:MAG: GNAT family N-acetyltransferase [Alphaproteobacteria bacterium]